MRINKENIESVPSDYFSNLKANIVANTLEDDIFGWNDFPILSSIQKSDDFEIPAGYHTALKGSILKSKNKTPKLRLFKLRKYAAVLLILLSGFVFAIFTNDQTSIQELQLAENEVDILDFYIDNPGELDMSHLDLLDHDEDLNFSEEETINILNYLEQEIDFHDLEMIVNF